MIHLRSYNWIQYVSVCVCVCVLVSRANPHPSEEGMGLVTLVKDFSAQVLN